jgi:hypothetical protein
MTDATLKLKIAISADAIETALHDALAGSASRYWLDHVEAQARPVGRDSCAAPHRWPLLGGSLIVFEREPDDGHPGRYLLSLLHVEVGIRRLLEQSPTQFGRVLAKTGDNWTHDLFLQLCLWTTPKYA